VDCKFSLRNFIVLSLLIFAGCNIESREHAQREAAAREFFERNCAQCHGANGEGKQIEDKFVPSLRHGRVVAYSDERITNQITYGGGGMPPFRFQLREDQIRDMVRYVREMQKSSDKR
jgi:mono/diheme cytochrome c family protein